LNLRFLHSLALTTLVAAAGAGVVRAQPPAASGIRWPTPEEFRRMVEARERRRAEAPPAPPTWREIGLALAPTTPEAGDSSPAASASADLWIELVHAGRRYPSAWTLRPVGRPETETIRLSLPPRQRQWIRLAPGVWEVSARVGWPWDLPVELAVERLTARPGPPQTLILGEPQEQALGDWMSDRRAERRREERVRRQARETPRP